MTSPALIGLPVPDFEAASTGRPFKLSAHLGKKLVLYFYPKDNTPGCTTEGQDFGASHGAFAAANALVFGVSRDSLGSHVASRRRWVFRSS